MKKIVVCCLLSVVSLAFISCGNNTSDKTVTNGKVSSSEIKYIKDSTKRAKREEYVDSIARSVHHPWEMDSLQMDSFNKLTKPKK